MDWFVIIVSVVALWVASLCKILHASLFSSNSTFGAGGALHKRNILLVIAHPDDESMGHIVNILCISTGNADGIGNIRTEELYKASTVLKVPFQRVKILDHPDFQDGFGKVWDPNMLAKIVDEEAIAHGIDMIITFDNNGVSGHCNHRDVYRGVRRVLLDRSIEAWELVSTNILRKYSGPVDIWFSIWYARYYASGQMHCLLNEHPRRSYFAMSQHHSQWVWFRKLFVSFSSYTYVNTLKKIEVGGKS